MSLSKGRERALKELSLSSREKLTGRDRRKNYISNLRVQAAKNIYAISQSKLVAKMYLMSASRCIHKTLIHGIIAHRSRLEIRLSPNYRRRIVMPASAPVALSQVPIRAERSYRAFESYTTFRSEIGLYP